MALRLTSRTGLAVTLPFPLQGIVTPGTSLFTKMSLTDLIAALGGVEASEALVINEVPDSQVPDEPNQIKSITLDSGLADNSFVDVATGQLAAVSPAGHVRIRSNNGVFEVSQNGGVYATVSTGSVTVGDPVVGGTPGSVLFVDAATNLAQSNAKFFWDNVTKRLGIGNSAPTATLDVTGDAKVSGSLTLAGSLVSIGDVGTGGTGFRVLRIPN